MKKAVYIIGVIAVIIGLTACPCEPVPCEPTYDTITYIDTIVYIDSVSYPVYDTTFVYDTIRILYPIYDTVIIYDTILYLDTVLIYQVYYDTIPVYDTILVDPEPDPEPTGLRPYGQDSTLYSEISFHDEFEGDELDMSKWNDRFHNNWEYNPYPNYEVSDGNLVMWVITDDNGEFVKRNIDTYGNHHQIYGYFEMEAKLPRGAGVYPAFWLWHDDSYTYRPEIDIVEAYGWIEDGEIGSVWADDNLNLYTYQSTTWNDGRAPDISQAGHTRFYPTIPRTNLSNSFHKFACRWDETGVEYFFDGQSFAKHNTISINVRMYILLWMWYHGEERIGSGELSIDNLYTPTGKDNAFVINYVRIWNLAN